MSQEAGGLDPKRKPPPRCTSKGTKNGRGNQAYFDEPKLRSHVGEIFSKHGLRECLRTCQALAPLE